MSEQVPSLLEKFKREPILIVHLFGWNLITKLSVLKFKMKIPQNQYLLNLWEEVIFKMKLEIV